MIEFITTAMHKGRPWMWPILVGAVLAMGISIRRLLHLWSVDTNNRLLFQAVAEMPEA